MREGHTHAVSAEQMRQAANAGASSRLTRAGAKLTVRDRRRPRPICSAPVFEFAQNGFLVSYKPLASSGSSARYLA